MSENFSKPTQWRCQLSIAGQLAVPVGQIGRELDSDEARMETFGSVRPRYLRKFQANPFRLLVKTPRTEVGRCFTNVAGKLDLYTGRAAPAFAIHKISSMDLQSFE